MPDAFSGAVGARLYRTGDAGRWNERGELEYVGRLDGQVKLRGTGSSLGEMSAGARESCGREHGRGPVQADGVGGEARVAYVQAARGWEGAGSSRKEWSSDGEYRLPNELAMAAP